MSVTRSVHESVGTHTLTERSQSQELADQANDVNIVDHVNPNQPPEALELANENS